MFSNIMIPVDLAHSDKLGHALQVGADLAKLYGAAVTYVAVTAATPSSVAHTPEEFATKLDAFAKAEGEKHGHTAKSHAMTSHDPSADLDPTLLKAVDETSADLVVMASHVPNIADYVWPSNGGTVATRAKVSVLVVRG